MARRPARLTNGHAKARHSANSGAATAQSLGFRLFFLRPVLTPEQGGASINQSKRIIYNRCRKRIRGACWAGPGRVYCLRLLCAMSNSSVFRSRRKLLKADLQLYDCEFQTDGALTLKAFADNASVIRSADSNSLSADRRVQEGW